VKTSNPWEFKEIGGLFDILKELWDYDQDKIQKLAGFDAMVFSTMVFFMFKLLLILIPMTFLLIVPVYSSGGAGIDDIIDKMTLSNIKSNEQWRIWFTLIVAILIHGGSTWFLRENFRKLSIRADKFNAENTESHYTVLIQAIPEEKTKGTNLYDFLDRVYPGRVCNVNLCYELKDVQKLWLKYKAAEKKRELCQSTDNKEVGCCCMKKDLATCTLLEADAKNAFYAKDINELPLIPVAIAQFKDITTTTICSSAVLIPGGEGMQVRAVPEFPEEILWRNLSQTDIRRQMGTYVGTVLYMMLIVFYSPVMVFIQGLANIDKLAATWSGFEAVLDLNSSVKAILQGTLPAVVFSLFFVILPIFLRQLSKLAVPAFKTDENEMTLRRYADCLVGMGLLVSVFSSGILSSMDAISELSASLIWETLGEEVPAQSVFFLTYVITAAFINMAMNLAMVIPFFKNLCGLYAPATFDYEVQYGVMILMFTICVTYAVISPLILVWGCLYFLFAYITFTYQLVYIFKRGNDTGGRNFPAVYGRLNYGMVIGQLVIIAMMVLQEAIPQAVLFLFVPLYTISTRRESKRKYGYYFGRTSLISAQNSDEAVKRKGETPIVQGENSFMSPAVKALIGEGDIEADQDDAKEEPVVSLQHIESEPDEPVNIERVEQTEEVSHQNSD